MAKYNTRQEVEAFEIVREYYIKLNNVSVNETGSTDKFYDDMIAEMQSNINYWTKTASYKLDL